MKYARNARSLAALAVAIALSPAADLLARFSAADCQTERRTPTLEKTKSKAETSHEIVMLLIRKKEFTQAAEEANKIFQMNWPSDQEPTLLKELLFFADQFLHQDQAAIGVQLLEANSRSFKLAASQVAIWKEKGYLFKRMGQESKALECFRQAQRLEK